MPKLIDWGVRYELIREAVICIAARDGAAVVSMAGVAGEMQVSVSTLRRTVDDPNALRGMGAELLARRRRQRRYLRGCPRGVERGSAEHVTWILTSEIPIDDEDLADERAWAQLTGEPVSGECRTVRREDEKYLDLLLEGALAKLGTDVASRRQHTVRLRAVLDGLIAARCRDAVTSEEAIECLETCLRELPLEPGISPDAA